MFGVDLPVLGDLVAGKGVLRACDTHDSAIPGLWYGSQLLHTRLVSGLNCIERNEPFGTGYADDYIYYYHRPAMDDVHGYGPVLLAGSEIVRLLKNVAD